MKRLEVDPGRLFASRRCLTTQRVVVGDRLDIAKIVPGQHRSPLPNAFAPLQTNLVFARKLGQFRRHDGYDPRKYERASAGGRDLHVGHCHGREKSRSRFQAVRSDAASASVDRELAPFNGRLVPFVSFFSATL
jgi:hypothetical protein